jgi:hypothetical protein
MSDTTTELFTTVELGQEATAALEEIAELRETTFEEAMADIIGLGLKITRDVARGKFILMHRPGGKAMKIIFPVPQVSHWEIAYREMKSARRFGRRPQTEWFSDLTKSAGGR